MISDAHWADYFITSALGTGPSLTRRLLPEMDSFLFADVGKEADGIPLRVLSALARLGVDPRDEAARLSRLTSKAAASQLARLLARLPDRPWTPPELRRIANRLVELLPAPPKGGDVHQDTSAANQKLSSLPSRRLIYLALALSGALVFGLIAHGHVTPGGNETAQPSSQPDSPSASIAR